jgi:predicted DNA-binding transcriptional regulator AlpA
MSSVETPEPIELWDRQTVLEFFGGLHFSTLYRGISSGFYPKPINTSGNTVRWLASECRAALQRMIAERDQSPKRQEYRGRPRGRGRKAATEGKPRGAAIKAEVKADPETQNA